MSHEARRGCIRKANHPENHRNRIHEWEEGRTCLAFIRPDRVEIPEGLCDYKGAHKGAWRKGYVQGLAEKDSRKVAKNPYGDWRTDRGCVTFSRSFIIAWDSGYKAGHET